MKRFLKLLKPPVIRKIVYSLVSKIVIALAIILLWDRLLNQKSVHPWGIVDTGFFALSIWFVIGAWIQYLAFDGFRPFHSLRSRKKERSINAWEEEELEEDEMQAARLCSNLLTALFFLIPSLIANIMM